MEHLKRWLQTTITVVVGEDGYRRQSQGLQMTIMGLRLVVWALFIGDESFDEGKPMIWELWVEEIRGLPEFKLLTGSGRDGDRSKWGETE